jgi:hypothetical protein
MLRTPVENDGDDLRPESAEPSRTGTKLAMDIVLLAP